MPFGVLTEGIPLGLVLFWLLLPMWNPGRRSAAKRQSRTPKPTPPPAPASPGSARVKLWVQPRRGRPTLPEEPTREAGSPRPRVQVLISPHHKPPTPDFEVEADLEPDAPSTPSRIRMMVAPKDYSARNALISGILVSLLWVGAGGLVLGGGWVALQLVVNPGSVGWLSWMFPEWSREAERYQRDAPKTLTELKILAEKDGLLLGQPLVLGDESAHTKNGEDLLIPVLERPQGCQEAASCNRIQELRVYHREPGGREARYRLGDRLPIDGPDEFFVTAPLVQVTGMGPGSTRALPMNTLERFSAAPSSRGIWFTTSGGYQPGRDRIRFGYIGWYDPRWRQLRLVMPWTSPAGQMPKWQPITGGGTPELVVDQTIGLEPSFRVYQLAAATREQPIQLNEVSLQQTPVETSAYENGLLLARHGLWSPALELLRSVKERRGDRWPPYAQAQLDVVKLHAEVTQKNAERDWANPSEKLMAQIIDGRWELAWDSLIQGLQGGDDTVRLLRPETRQLWQRLSTASRISPGRDAIRRWVSLMQYTRGGREAAIASLQGQSGTTLVSQTLDSQSRRILQQIDETLMNQTEQSAAANRFYGTATPIPPSDPRNWQQPNGSPPSPDENVQWYRIQLVGVHQAEGWRRSPFPSLLGPAPTPRYLWNQLGLLQEANLQLITWDAAGQPQNRTVTAQALRWSNGAIEILASGEPIPDAPSEPLLAYTNAAFTWQNSQGNTRLQDLALQNLDTAETLAQALRTELQQHSILGSDDDAVEGDAAEGDTAEGNAPFFEQSSWLVDSIDLTGDSQPETILNLQENSSRSPAAPRTLIFSSQGRLLYSELSRDAGQRMLAIANTPDDPRPFLITRQNNTYSLRQWSPQNQRFE